MKKPTKAQNKRDEENKAILDLVISGLSNDEICKICNCTIGKVKSVKERYGFTPHRIDMSVIRIDDYKEEPKKSVAKPCVAEGKRYLDVTGDIVDCGNAYR